MSESKNEVMDELNHNELLLTSRHWRQGVVWEIIPELRKKQLI